MFPGYTGLLPHFECSFDIVTKILTISQDFNEELRNIPENTLQIIFYEKSIFIDGGLGMDAGRRVGRGAVCHAPSVPKLIHGIKY